MYASSPSKGQKKFMGNNIETVHWHHCLIAYPFFVFLYTFLIISGGMPYLLATYKENKFWKCSYSALTTITQKIKMQIRG